MTGYKTYIGAGIVVLGGIVGLSVKNYFLGNFLIALGFAVIAIGFRHALERLIKK